MRQIEYTVPPEDDGRLIKRVIRGSMQLSHKQFSALKATGRMLLDGVPVRANHIVRTGQRISLVLDAEDYTPAEPDDAPVCIVYEDDDLLVIDKEAPLACQCSTKHDGMTLENRMAHYLPDRPFRPVNRLDKGTSGLMIAAKHAHAQMLLSRQLHTEDFQREYKAVLVGAPPHDAGTIDAPIAKDEGATVRRIVREDGRRAVTHYRVERRVQGLSLAHIRLETGRTHQIRVHMGYIGCPVFGDFLYGVERPDILPGRFALHSAYLSFIHPMTGERMRFISPLPDELEKLLQI